MDEHFEEQLKTLKRLYKEADHVYGELASYLGMSDTEFWILSAVSHTEEPVTQNDLCSELFFPVQTIHSAIGKLLKKELVVLRVIPKTKNRKEILLTEKGEAFVQTTLKKADEIEEKAFLQFSQEEREQYLSFLKRHIEYLEKEKQCTFENSAD